MRTLLAVIACATLLIGCARDQQTTIDPTTAGSMGASGAGAARLPDITNDVSTPTPP
jgi:hypothetical protein